MRVLDDEGRLFGWINVVDALVVVAALALVAGGVFVVLAGTGTDNGTSENPDLDPEPLRYATVTYSAALDSRAADLSPGAELVSGGDAYDVTDVSRSFTPDGEAHVTARLVYRGAFEPGGDSALAGDDVGFATNHSRLGATVEAVGQESGIMDTTETSLVVRANASRPGASAVEVGDDVRVGGDVVGTIEAVDDRQEDTLIGLTVTTRETSAGPAYGGRPVRVGSRFGIVTDEAIVDGRVVALRTSEPGDVG